MEVGMELFARVRERLIDGTLWPLMDGQVYASPGTGAECSVCDQPITEDDVDYEVAGPTRIVRVHVECYQAWSGECQQSA